MTGIKLLNIKNIKTHDVNYQEYMEICKKYYTHRIIDNTMTTYLFLANYTSLRLIEYNDGTSSLSLLIREIEVDCPLNLLDEED